MSPRMITETGAGPVDYRAIPIRNGWRRHILRFLAHSPAADTSVVVVASCGYAATGGGQRPAQLARAFANLGMGTIYVHNRDTLGEVDGLVTMSSEDFVHIADHVSRRTGVAIYGLANLYHAADLLSGGWAKVFDLCDDWEEFHRIGHLPAFGQLEYETVIRITDVVSCSAQKLMAIARKYRAKRTALVRNAGPSAPVPSCDPPAGMLTGKVNLIYLGSTWGKWLNWYAMDKLATDVRRIGGVINIVGGERPAAMPKHRNVRWHRELPYDEAMRYVAASDVGLCPFRDYALCASVDPIKYYDYTAARCRTVATSVLTELAGRDYVHLAPSYAFLSGVRAALAAEPIDEGEAQQFCRVNSWERRAWAILNAAGSER